MKVAAKRNVNFTPELAFYSDGKALKALFLEWKNYADPI